MDCTSPCSIGFKIHSLHFRALLHTMRSWLLQVAFLKCFFQLTSTWVWAIEATGMILEDRKTKPKYLFSSLVSVATAPFVEACHGSKFFCVSDPWFMILVISVPPFGLILQYCSIQQLLLNSWSLHHFLVASQWSFKTFVTLSASNCLCFMYSELFLFLWLDSD